MIVRRLSELEPARVVDSTNWLSRRLLLRGDGMGFSMHDTIIRAGTATEIHYANHLEAVYCIEGEGSIELLPSGEVFSLQAGTLYALDEHDRHLLKAVRDMRMICVFNPALLGPEVHDADGVYPLLDDTGQPVAGSHGQGGS